MASSYPFEQSLASKKYSHFLSEAEAQTAVAVTPTSIVLPYYILSGVSLLVVCLMITFSANSFQVHYFQPRLLCITHIATLGFITSSIFGSLYLILPVLLNVSLYSKKLATVTFYFLVFGILTLCYSFWNFSTGPLMQTGACFLLLSFILFSFNYYKSIEKSQKNTIEEELMTAASIWLLVTGIIGALLVFNFSYPIFLVSHLQILKLHAHIGFVGWIFLLVAAVSSRLIELFFGVNEKSKSTLSIVYYCINGGLLLLCIVLYAELNDYLLYTAILVITVGIISFLHYLIAMVTRRLSDKLATGLHLPMISLSFLVPAVIIGFIVPSALIAEKEKLLLGISYGITGFLGFSGTIILAQGIKITSFITWIQEYGSIARQKNKLLSKDSVSEQLSITMMMVFVLGVVILLVSIPLQLFSWIKVAGALLVLVAVCHNVNLYKSLIHKGK